MDMKLLLENFKKFENKILNEVANPADLDPKRFPLPLSQVHPVAARAHTKTGADDYDDEGGDDVIPTEPKNSIAAAKDLNPSQSSMKIDKAVAFVIQMLHPKGKLKPGGNLGTFISKDKFIMDGHHRWIATGMIDPNLSLGGYKVEWPGKQLVAVLNAITKGMMGIMKGKEGSGGFDQFNEVQIRKWLNKYLQEGVWENLQPEDVREAIETWTQQQGDAAVEAAVKKMVDNLGELNLSPPGWKMDRTDMPVIDKDKVPNAGKIAADALNTGKIDVSPPYGTKDFLDKRKKALKK